MPSDSDLHWNSPTVLLVSRPADPEKNHTIQSLWSPAYQLYGLACFNNTLLFQGCILENSSHYEKRWKEHTLQGWERGWGDYLLESRLWSTYSHILSKTSSNNLHELTISFSLQYSMSIPFLPPTKDIYGWNTRTHTHTHTQTHTHITNINTHITWSSQTYILLKMLANLQLGKS